jgi:hypothetical protein
MERISLIIGIMLVLILTGCKDLKPQNADDSVLEEDSLEVADSLTEEESMDELISEEPMPVSAEELFDDFLFNFASNKRLQMERVKFPIIVSSEAKADTLEKNDWQMEHFFMHHGEYTLIFDSEAQMEAVKDTSVNHAIVEKIFMDQGFVCQYQFDRKNGRWMLDRMNKQTMSHNPNASFLSFYRRFATDSVFRQQSLAQEIAFSGPDPDNDFDQMEGVITPDFWEAFAPELPHGTIYNIVYGHPHSHSNTKIFVLRGIANGLEVEMTFHREHNQWRLTKLSE